MTLAYELQCRPDAPNCSLGHGSTVCLVGLRRQGLFFRKITGQCGILSSAKTVLRSGEDQDWGRVMVKEDLAEMDGRARSYDEFIF